MCDESYKYSLSSCKQKIEWLTEMNKELLEACKEAFHWFSDVHKYDPNTPEWMKTAQQAIAKSEGRE